MRTAIQILKDIAGLAAVLSFYAFLAAVLP
jgi:hypothetical protein